MTVMPTEMDEVSSVEGRLIEVLREKGPQTLESLCALPDVSLAQVLLAVDRLTRSSGVVMERTAPCEYSLSLNMAGA